MSDNKEKKKKAPKPSAAEAAPGEEGAPAQKKPPLMIIGLGVVLFLGAGAGVFFVMPSAPAGEETESAHGEIAEGETPDSHAKNPAAEPQAHGARKDHGGKKDDKEKKDHDGGHGDKGSQKGGHNSGKEGAAAPPVLGQFTVAGETGFYLPDPFVVSLDPRAGAKHLKIALAIEAPPETASLYEEQSLRLRDVMTTYLRAVDAAALGDPAAMSSIREQLKRRIEYVVSPENVKDVLILDFILT